MRVFNSVCHTVRNASVFHIPTKKKNRIVQVDLTSSCDLSCSNCTRALAQLRKPDMTPTQFEQAVLASKNWIIRENGVLSLFGGNPITSKYFEECCAILAAHLPERNRGLWTNNLLKKGHIAARYFSKDSIFNFNVHQDKEAANKFREFFPGVPIYGEDRASMHASIFIASGEFLPMEEVWEKVEHCTYDIEWSAIIVQEAPDWTITGGYSCEIASTHARVNGVALGVPIEPGWLDLMEKDFQHQYEFACQRCSGCLNLKGTPDLGEGAIDQFSKTNAHIAEKSWAKNRLTHVFSEIPENGGFVPIDYLRLWGKP